uniref:Retrovirus-related Pol polyprotein from transposon TNT 1-94-like beta-barrel domain-containing protein n=1 Tax=Lactuca sativa TaxID=4236 RepID=A0A9R1XRS1_LACSA|nr:hypothetical protein LSAT_V11C200079080 [Lactuca sativa]
MLFADFISRSMDTVSQLRAYGEEISDQTIVEKDLSILSVNQLMGSLSSHEARIKRSPKKIEEKALKAHDTSSYGGRGSRNFQAKDTTSFGGRGSGSFRGRSRGRGGFGRGRGRNSVHCKHCNHFGHVKDDCWFKDQHVSYAAEENLGETEEDKKLFMVRMAEDDHKERTHMALMMCAGDVNKANNIWFIDSGCSNHMTRQREVFSTLDNTQKMVVQIGDGKKLYREGQGTVKTQLTTGKTRLVHEVFFGLMSKSITIIGKT